MSSAHNARSGASTVGMRRCARCSRVTQLFVSGCTFDLKTPTKTGRCLIFSVHKKTMVRGVCCVFFGSTEAALMGNFTPISRWPAKCTMTSLWIHSCARSAPPCKQAVLMAQFAGRREIFHESSCSRPQKHTTHAPDYISSSCSAASLKLNKDIAELWKTTWAIFRKNCKTYEKVQRIAGKRGARSAPLSC